MIKVKKDLIFTILVILYTISNIVSYNYLGMNGVFYSNNIFVFILLILCGFKYFNKKFGNWLETKI